MPSPPSSLKITKIKCGYIKGSLFVKIYTNQNIWGCGEGVDAIPSTYYLVKDFERRLKGQNPLNVNRLFENIRKSGFFQGAQANMYVAVLSAIEIALWDLKNMLFLVCHFLFNQAPAPKGEFGCLTNSTDEHG